MLNDLSLLRRDHAFWRNSLRDKAELTHLGSALPRFSRALTVYLRLAALVVLLLADPHLLEGPERRQDRAAVPGAEPACHWLRRADHLELDVGRSSGGQVAGQAVSETRL